MMKKGFYGLVVCLSMFAVVICSGVASAAGIGDPCTNDADCIDTIFCNGIESCAVEGSATVCAAGTAPCTGDTPECVEETDTCVATGCDPDTPQEVLDYDEDKSCFLSKEELKTYNDTLKADQKKEKDDLKIKQTDEKNTYKMIKSDYAE